jgi:CheY-like chemotaxis protein/nitrogen-specific signal transduction histidine kinase
VSRLPLEATAALTVTLTDLTTAKAHAALEKAHVQARASEAKLLLADRKKDEFFATIATELRNPLGPVRNLVEVLRRKGAATPDVEWAQNVIDRQVQRMARLVDELLDLSGIAHDQIELQRQRVALADIVHAAHDRCATLFEEWGHEVVLEADPVRLTQVFANLLTNAANYSNRFGRIEIEGASGDGTVIVTVRDNGAGIAAEQLPHIFDMFARIDRSVRGEQTNLGIGLALVKRVVDLHGGTVEARSEGAGRGSEFIVTLPVPVTGDHAAPGAAPSGAGRRIMIVDDHADGADALATMLRVYGNEVRAVYQGAEAMAIGASFEPDTVLLDLGMPGLDGYEVCSLIRGSSWGDRAHVIAITGRGQPDDRRRTFESGFDRHLVKPVDPSTLASILASLPPRRPSPLSGMAHAET